MWVSIRELQSVLRVMPLPAQTGHCRQEPTGLCLAQAKAPSSAE